MKLDMCGEPLEVGNWVVMHTTRQLRVLRVCKITSRMIVVEYFTPKLKQRKTFHLYASDVVKVSDEAVFRMELMK